MKFGFFIKKNFIYLFYPKISYILILNNLIITKQLLIITFISIFKYNFLHINISLLYKNNTFCFI